MKRLIINADDFGFTRDVNAGIIEAHTTGVLTSTTLMANGDAFEDAVRLARLYPTLDVGCHLVLVQGRSVIDGAPLAQTLREVLARLVQKRLNAYHELRAQIQKILDAGIRPTHLDSHKHTHIVPAIFGVVVRLAEEFSIPYVRLPLDRTTPYAGWVCGRVDPLYRKAARQRNVCMTDHFLGYRLTGALNEASLLGALQTLKEGTTEFMCHPGLLGPELQSAPTRLKESRVCELQALTSPRVRTVMDAAGVRLATFGTPDEPPNRQ